MGYLEEMSSILLHVLWNTNVRFGWVLNDVHAPLMVKPTFHLLFMFIPECRNVIFLSFFEFLDYLRIIRFYFSNLKNIHVDMVYFDFQYERGSEDVKWQGWKSCAPWHSYHFIMRGLQLVYLFFVVFISWRRKDAYYFK